MLQNANRNGAHGKSLNLREQNLLKERDANKKLTAELDAKKQEAFAYAQEAHALDRSLKRREAECNVAFLLLPLNSHEWHEWHAY